MSVIRWDPSAEIGDLRRSVRRLFDDLRLDAVAPTAFPVDVYEAADEIVVLAELPGVRAEGVAVRIEGGHLSIRAARESRVPEGVRVLQRETVSGEFSRTFGLGVPVDADKVSARYENGILTIRLPKAEEARSRKIEVEVA